MAKESPKLYSIEKTFLWFAAAGLILLISLILMVGQDYAREWKGWQRKFLRLKYEKTQAEAQALQEKVDRDALTALEKQHQEAEKTFKAQKSSYQPLEKEIEKLNIQIAKVRARYQDQKQYLDSYKYYLEESRLHHHEKEAREYDKKFTEISPRVEALKLQWEALEKQVETKQAAIDEMKAEEKRLSKEIQRLTAEKERTERKAAKLKPSWVHEILNAPMLDFLRPTLQVQQIVLEDLYDDFHFAKVQKVDRCTTCHLGIDQKGFEDAPQPFRTHPQIDLFLGSNSPHPMEKFGCTTCHGGNGHSMSFKDAAHTPQTEEQKKAWEKNHNWHRLEKWEAKMLPLNHIEAACAKCHTGVVDIPKAEKLNEGRRLVRTYGCFGCHKIEGFDDLWKVGPSFRHVNSKVDKDWIVRWLQNPKAFRPTTHMPRIFHLSNTDSPEDRERNHAAIEGIAHYLLARSEETELQEPPAKGDTALGEKLVNDRGCMGCHSVGEKGVNNHGPNLAGMGSKTTPAWIYSWIQNPKHYYPETRMPEVRLTEEEASHVTAYLMTLRNEKFESEPLPPVTAKAVDEMVESFLRGTLRKEEARAEMDTMDSEARLVYLGEKMISQQGCFGCHDVPGFEDAKPIGTELTKEGMKEVERLDFGFVPLDRTRHAWFFHKLKEPRAFDQGKIKTYFEKLKMPQFDFTDAEAESLVTFLLSQVEEPIPMEMKRNLNLKEQEIEHGRLLAAKMNCRGCHVLEGRGGRVKELLADPGAAPPPLDGEGAKVQEAWLYDFLKSPVTIRPWLTYHMPTFGFNHQQLTALVKYFSHLSDQDIFFGQAEQAPPPSVENLAAGKLLFEKFQCAKCHEVRTGAVLGASFLAPDLTLAKSRLKHGWIVDWLKDPQAVQPGTMMPAFFPDGQSPAPDILGGDAQKQMEALRDYLLEYEKGSVLES